MVPARGASVGVALAGDIVVAARSAYFYEPFVGIALVPDAGNTLFMPRLAGRVRAAPAMLLGERISAEEALSWGLVWRVFDDAQLAASQTDAAIAQRLTQQETPPPSPRPSASSAHRRTLVSTRISTSSATCKAPLAARRR